MTNKLTNAQIGLLHAALLRVDRCVVAPAGKGAAARKIAAKMIEAGWLKEIKAKSDAPVWRTEEATGAVYSLKLTGAGLKVIAAYDGQGSAMSVTPAAPSSKQVEEHKDASASKSEPPETPPAQPTFREGSKLAEVMKLLRQEGGVSVDELSTTMNWLPRSTRAVLTGLRKRGVVVTRRKTPDQRASAYAVETASVGASGQG